jgi:ribosomal-protein-alanine N-acetyltransferase
MRVRSMRDGDLEQVLVIERKSFASPWSGDNFRHEIHRNRFAVNYVLEREETILGYACVWFVGRELKINNIAIRAEERRKGLGELLLKAVLRSAAEVGCLTAELEVRESNLPAQRLYRKHGFVQVGRRRNYYRHEGEDALLFSMRLRPRDTPVAGDGSSGV